MALSTMTEFNLQLVLKSWRSIHAADDGKDIFTVSPCYVMYPRVEHLQRGKHLKVTLKPAARRRARAVYNGAAIGGRSRYKVAAWDIMWFWLYLIVNCTTTKKI